MDLVKIFYHLDEFCKHFEKEYGKNIFLPQKKRKRKRHLLLSEVMTIMVYFHHSGYKTFKDYYCKYVQIHLKDAFPDLISYNRFIEREQEALFPLHLFMKLTGMNQCTGISYIDSTPIKACNTRRASSHKTLRGLVTKGKTSTGWFFGMKIHLIINHNGQIIDFDITNGSTADSNRVIIEKLTKNIKGKLFGDKAYLGQELFEWLYHKGIDLKTKIRNNMKNKLIDMLDKLLLKKRGIIESVIAILKEELSLEHTRHRSKTNFFVHICSALTAYFFRDKKPSINLSRQNISC